MEEDTEVAAAGQSDSTRVLPEETLLAVFQLLVPECLVRAGQVCRRWRRVSRDERLWKHRQLQLRLDRDWDPEVSFKRVSCVLLVAPCIKALAMPEVHLGDHLAARMLRLVRVSNCKIQQLNLPFYPYTKRYPWFCELLHKQARTLVTLRIAEVDMDNIFMMELMGRLQHLSILRPSGVSVHTPSDASSLKHLLSLSMSKQGSDTDESRLLKMLLKHNSASLEEASVRIQYRSTLAVLICCENLKKLEIIDVFVGRNKLDKDFLLYLEDLPRLTDLILHIVPDGFHKYRLYGGLNVCHLEFLPEQISSLTMSFQISPTNVQPLLKRLRDLANLQQAWIHGIESIYIQEMLKGSGPQSAKYVFT